MSGLRAFDGLDPRDVTENPGESLATLRFGLEPVDAVIRLNEVAQTAIITRLFSAFLTPETGLPSREDVNECLTSVGLAGNELEAVSTKIMMIYTARDLIISGFAQRAGDMRPEFYEKVLVFILDRFYTPTSFDQYQLTTLISGANNPMAVSKRR